MRRTIEGRFLEKVAIGDDCWEWQASKGSRGYGQFSTGRVSPAGHQIPDLAHRISYELFVGPIPEGLVIDHLCRNNSCVRPDHLEPVTQRENLLRGETLQAANAAKTHCRHGHPFDEVNTYMHEGKRYCRMCRREYRRERDAKKV